MRNFKQLVWEDEGKPLEGETVLVCYRDPVNGDIKYDCAVFENGVWHEPYTGGIFKEIEAWAYIPQCAFIYPYRRLNND